MRAALVVPLFFAFIGCAAAEADQAGVPAPGLTAAPPERPPVQ